MWVFDVDAEAQLLQHTPFSFYHLVFGVYVVLIKYQWAWTPDSWRNESKMVSLTQILFNTMNKNCLFVCFILNSKHSVSLSTNYRQQVQFFDSCNFSVRLLVLPQVTVKEKKKLLHLSPHHSFNRKFINTSNITIMH